MDDKDFREIDKETDRLMANFVGRFKLGGSNNAFDRLHNTFLSNEESPPETILIPIGTYNGINLPGIIIGLPCQSFGDLESPEFILSDSVVWMEVENPEYGEMI